ncbi:hypothetical protein AAMO2058_001169200 [Amorphochlora amoebiformis]
MKAYDFAGKYKYITRDQVNNKICSLRTKRKRGSLAIDDGKVEQDNSDFVTPASKRARFLPSAMYPGLSDDDLAILEGTMEHPAQRTAVTTGGDDGVVYAVLTYELAPMNIDEFKGAVISMDDLANMLNKRAAHGVPPIDTKKAIIADRRKLTT